MTTTTTWNQATPARADNVEIAPRVSEDWLSLIIGLFIFVLALAGIANVDLLGWLVTTSVWTDVSKALGTVSKSYVWLGGFGALVATYLALLAVLSAVAVALKSDTRNLRSLSPRCSESSTTCFRRRSDALQDGGALSTAGK